MSDEIIQNSLWIISVPKSLQSHIDPREFHINLFPISLYFFFLLVFITEVRGYYTKWCAKRLFWQFNSVVYYCDFHFTHCHQVCRFPHELILRQKMLRFFWKSSGVCQGLNLRPNACKARPYLLAYHRSILHLLQHKSDLSIISRNKLSHQDGA